MNAATHESEELTMADRPRITFRTDQPQLLTLAKHPPGHEVHGRRGEIDYMYTVMGESGGESVMFLPPQAAAELDRSQAREGDSVQITKRKGNWEVVHVVEEPQQRAYQQQAPPPAFGFGIGPNSPPPPPLQSQPRGPQPAATLSQQPRTEEDRLTEQLAASVRTMPAQSSTASMYSRYLCAAIDAWVLAVQYAKERGLPINPAAEDIRATAATFYIQATKETK